MLALASQAQTQEWWARYGDVLPGWFEPYLGLEASASRIRSFDLQFVHGLFQTEAYARAVTSLGHRGFSRDEIDRWVAVRMKRQELLTAPNPSRVWSIMDEAALRRPVGGVTVMRDQLRRLAEVAELPNVTLQVVPFAAGGHDAAGGSFTILRFSEPDVARCRVHRAAHRGHLPGEAGGHRSLPRHHEPAQRHVPEPGPDHTVLRGHRPGPAGVTPQTPQ